MNPIIALLDLLLGIYGFLVLVYVIIHLLSHFNVINTANQAVINISNFLARIIEPALTRLREYFKPVNGLDITPMVLLIIIWFIRYCLYYYFIL